MNAHDIVASTAEAAFATSEGGRIVAWNPAAERLLGHLAAKVVGRRCYQVLRARDVFGNRYCNEACPLARMARRSEAMHPFELDYLHAGGERVRARVSPVAVPGDAPGERVIVHLLGPQGRPAETGGGNPGPGAAELTPREIEVLGLLADGAATGEIARRLSISAATVRNHIQNLLGKLGAHSRLQAVSLARYRRILP